MTISKCSVLFKENIVQKRFQDGERKELAVNLGNVLRIQKTEQSIWLLVWKEQMVEGAGLIDSVEEVEWSVMWDEVCKWYVTSSGKNYAKSCRCNIVE